MKQIFTFLAVYCATACFSYGQTNTALPYAEIPGPPEEYTAGTISARMIDGLGFRYYWTTEGLRDEDLDYRPSDDARTSRETLDHIYQLSTTIKYAISGSANPTPTEKMSFEDIRKKTLENFEEASKTIGSNTSEEIAEIKVGTAPYWNLINGPIADALWHCGQVVSFRRSSGNPFNPKVNVFSGKVNK